MQTERYRGYTLWGHAILQQEDILQPARFASSGTVTHETSVVEVSGNVGVFDSEEQAESSGLAWCRAWLDNHV
ncbi:hypothetical protein [Burkholderia sp. Ac-20365]|uniref:hypothetical protein n=1 Tax=Burkholderia sp. Ac-20365 TaxID=2703897 RepID=UPI001F11B1E0|nr:hypothetical protein [Burkholderia sp. Ac-20365]